MASILLVCAGGMSTSLIVEKMKSYVKPEMGEIKIDALPAERVEEVAQNYDVILLGPQIRYKKKDFEKYTKEFGIPIDVINPADYGMVRGDKILEQALKLIRK